MAFSFTAQAQTGTIRGVISDAKTSEPLIGASVLVKETSNGAAADLDGNYIIKNLPAGTYTLIVSYVSYNEITQPGVVIDINKETVVDFDLMSDDINLQEVEIVARINRESENILLMEQRQALIATQSVGARELSRKGIGNAQAAVSQVSGISRQEGIKNVFVRGLGDRYNTTLLNGFPIPSEDPEYKNISLEFFGTDIIQNIGVNKVFSGNSYSDVGGAVIDISSKELLNDYELVLELSGGLNSAAVTQNFQRQDGSGYLGFANNNRPLSNQYDFPNSLDPKPVSLPMNHSFGLTGGKSFKLGKRNNPLSFYGVASHSTDYSYTEENVRNANTIGNIWQDQNGDKYSQNTNQLLLGNLMFGINKKHNLHYNFMLIHANDQSVSKYSGLNAERHQGALNDMGIAIRQQTNDNLLIVNQLFTDWLLTNSLRLDAGISYNTVKGLEPDRRENYFSLAEGNTYNLTRSNRNKRFFSELKNRDINPKVALTYSLVDRFGSENSNISIGYTARFVNDDFEAVEYNFSPLGMPAFSLDGLYLDDLYESSLKDGTLSMTTGRTNSYYVSKKIHSVYGDASYQLAQNLTANIGLRMDKVDLSVAYDVAHTTPGEVTINTDYFLPNINLKYDLNDKNSLRLGASKTYTLPQSKEISPYQYVNISFASQGNPNIKPSDNYNIDLKWDYYLSPGELLSVTGFYKYIERPIGRVDQANSAGLLTYDNISDHAVVGGIEFELRKNIFNRYDTQRERMNRLSVGLNASYIHTDVLLDILNTEPRNSALEGASPILANTDISYHYTQGEKSFVASLIFNYFSDRIHTVGAAGFKDIVEEGIPTMNFAATYSLNRQLSLKFSASNLLNSPYRLSRESSISSYKVILNEFKKGQNISLGISYEF
ncbi:MAG: TonB-dependent receptor [Fermentimonas sp.]|nr:TonB-dependent receptor [Fermentimonas sp.]